MKVCYENNNKKTERMFNLLHTIQSQWNWNGIFKFITKTHIKLLKRNEQKWNINGKKKIFQQSSINKPDFAKTNENALMFLNTASFKLVRV